MKYDLFNPSRDRRVEDPTNLWVIDPLARSLVPIAIRLRISANAISIIGLVVGAFAALAYARWQLPGRAFLGLTITFAWLIMDSLDGMVARATGTSSAFGRELDGLCDHGVFAMLYVALACSVGGIATWSLVIAAGLAHAVQANVYEAERNRFHQRLGGSSPHVRDGAARNPATRLYDWVTSRFEAASAPLDRRLADGAGRAGSHDGYEWAAVPVLRMMLPLSQNMRLAALFVACILGRMTLFFWFELVPLTVLTAIGVLSHRSVEARLLRTA